MDLLREKENKEEPIQERGGTLIPCQGPALKPVLRAIALVVAETFLVTQISWAATFNFRNVRRLLDPRMRPYQADPLPDVEDVEKQKEELLERRNLAIESGQIARTGGPLSTAISEATLRQIESQPLTEPLGPSLLAPSMGQAFTSSASIGLLQPTTVEESQTNILPSASEEDSLLEEFSEFSIGGYLEALTTLLPSAYEETRSFNHFVGQEYDEKFLGVLHAFGRHSMKALSTEIAVFEAELEGKAEEGETPQRSVGAALSAGLGEEVSPTPPVEEIEPVEDPDPEDDFFDFSDYDDIFGDPDEPPGPTQIFEMGGSAFNRELRDGNGNLISNYRETIGYQVAVVNNRLMIVGRTRTYTYTNADGTQGIEKVEWHYTFDEHGQINGKETTTFKDGWVPDRENKTAPVYYDHVTTKEMSNAERDEKGRVVRYETTYTSGNQEIHYILEVNKYDSADQKAEWKETTEIRNLKTGEKIILTTVGNATGYDEQGRATGFHITTDVKGEGIGQEKLDQILPQVKAHSEALGKAFQAFVDYMNGKQGKGMVDLISDPQMKTLIDTIVVAYEAFGEAIEGLGFDVRALDYLFSGAKSTVDFLKFFVDLFYGDGETGGPAPTDYETYLMEHFGTSDLSQVITKLHTEGKISNALYYKLSRVTTLEDLLDEVGDLSVTEVGEILNAGLLTYNHLPRDAARDFMLYLVSLGSTGVQRLMDTGKLNVANLPSFYQYLWKTFGTLDLKQVSYTLRQKMSRSTYDKIKNARTYEELLMILPSLSMAQLDELVNSGTFGPAIYLGGAGLIRLEDLPEELLMKFLDYKENTAPGAMQYYLDTGRLTLNSLPTNILIGYLSKLDKTQIQQLIDTAKLDINELTTFYRNLWEKFGTVNVGKVVDRLLYGHEEGNQLVLGLSTKYPELARKLDPVQTLDDLLKVLPSLTENEIKLLVSKGLFSGEFFMELIQGNALDGATAMKLFNARIGEIDSTFMAAFSSYLSRHFGVNLSESNFSRYAWKQFINTLYSDGKISGRLKDALLGGTSGPYTFEQAIANLIQAFRDPNLQKELLNSGLFSSELLSAYVAAGLLPSHMGLSTLIEWGVLKLDDLKQMILDGKIDRSFLVGQILVGKNVKADANGVWKGPGLWSKHLIALMGGVDIVTPAGLSQLQAELKDFSDIYGANFVNYLAGVNNYRTETTISNITYDATGQWASFHQVITTIGTIKLSNGKLVQLNETVEIVQVADGFDEQGRMTDATVTIKTTKRDPVTGDIISEKTQTIKRSGMTYEQGLLVGENYYQWASIVEKLRPLLGVTGDTFTNGMLDAQTFIDTLGLDLDLNKIMGTLPEGVTVDQIDQVVLELVVAFMFAAVTGGALNQNILNAAMNSVPSAAPELITSLANAIFGKLTEARTEGNLLHDKLFDLLKKAGVSGDLSKAKAQYLVLSYSEEVRKDGIDKIETHHYTYTYDNKGRVIGMTDSVHEVADQVFKDTDLYNLYSLFMAYLNQYISLKEGSLIERVFQKMAIGAFNDFKNAVIQKFGGWEKVPALIREFIAAFEAKLERGLLHSEGVSFRDWANRFDLPNKTIRTHDVSYTITQSDMKYDKQGRLVSYTEHWVGANPVTGEAAPGLTTDVKVGITYNPVGMIASQTFEYTYTGGVPENALAKRVLSGFVYDGFGNAVGWTETTTDLAGVVRIKYVSDVIMNHLTGEIESIKEKVVSSDGRTLNFRYQYNMQYDKFGRLMSYEGFQNGKYIYSQMTYNALDQLVKVVNQDGTTSNMMYNMLGQITGYDYKPWTGATKIIYVRNIRYDQFGRMIYQEMRSYSYTNDKNNGWTTTKHTYTYDTYGRVLAERVDAYFKGKASGKKVEVWDNSTQHYRYDQYGNQIEAERVTHYHKEKIKKGLFGWIGDIIKGIFQFILAPFKFILKNILANIFEVFGFKKFANNIRTAVDKAYSAVMKFVDKFGVLLAVVALSILSYGLLAPALLGLVGVAATTFALGLATAFIMSIATFINALTQGQDFKSALEDFGKGFAIAAITVGITQGLQEIFKEVGDAVQKGINAAAQAGNVIAKVIKAVMDAIRAVVKAVKDFVDGLKANLAFLGTKFWTALTEAFRGIVTQELGQSIGTVGSVVFGSFFFGGISHMMNTVLIQPLMNKIAERNGVGFYAYVGSVVTRIMTSFQNAANQLATKLLQNPANTFKTYAEAFSDAFKTVLTDVKLYLSTLLNEMADFWKSDFLQRSFSRETTKGDKIEREITPFGIFVGALLQSFALQPLATFLGNVVYTISTLVSDAVRSVIDVVRDQPATSPLQTISKFATSIGTAATNFWQDLKQNLPFVRVSEVPDIYLNSQRIHTFSNRYGVTQQVEYYDGETNRLIQRDLYDNGKLDTIERYSYDQSGTRLLTAVFDATGKFLKAIDALRNVLKAIDLVNKLPKTIIFNGKEIDPKTIELTINNIQLIGTMLMVYAMDEGLKQFLPVYAYDVATGLMYTNFDQGTHLPGAIYHGNERLTTNSDTLPRENGTSIPVVRFEMDVTNFILGTTTYSGTVQMAVGAYGQLEGLSMIRGTASISEGIDQNGALVHYARPIEIKYENGKEISINTFGQNYTLLLHFMDQMGKVINSRYVTYNGSLALRDGEILPQQSQGTFTEHYKAGDLLTVPGGSLKLSENLDLTYSYQNGTKVLGEHYLGQVEYVTETEKILLGGYDEKGVRLYGDASGALHFAGVTLPESTFTVSLGGEGGLPPTGKEGFMPQATIISQEVGKTMQFRVEEGQRGMEVVDGAFLWNKEGAVYKLGDGVAFRHGNATFRGGELHILRGEKTGEPDFRFINSAFTLEGRVSLDGLHTIVLPEGISLTGKTNGKGELFFSDNQTYKFAKFQLISSFGNKEWEGTVKDAELSVRDGRLSLSGILKAGYGVALFGQGGSGKAPERRYNFLQEADIVGQDGDLFLFHVGKGQNGIEIVNNQLLVSGEGSLYTVSVGKDKSIEILGKKAATGEKVAFVEGGMRILNVGVGLSRISLTGRDLTENLANRSDLDSKVKNSILNIKNALVEYAGGFDQQGSFSALVIEGIVKLYNQKGVELGEDTATYTRVNLGFEGNKVTRYIEISKAEGNELLRRDGSVQLRGGKIKDVSIAKWDQDGRPIELVVTYLDVRTAKVNELTGGFDYSAYRGPPVKDGERITYDASGYEIQRVIYDFNTKQNRVESTIQYDANHSPLRIEQNDLLAKTKTVQEYRNGELYRTSVTQIETGTIVDYFPDGTVFVTHPDGSVDVGALDQNGQVKTTSSEKPARYAVARAIATVIGALFKLNPEQRAWLKGRAEIGAAVMMVPVDALKSLITGVGLLLTKGVAVIASGIVGRSNPAAGALLFHQLTNTKIVQGIEQAFKSSVELFAQDREVLTKALFEQRQDFKNNFFGKGLNFIADAATRMEFQLIGLLAIPGHFADNPIDTLVGLPGFFVDVVLGAANVVASGIYAITGTKQPFYYYTGQGADVLKWALGWVPGDIFGGREATERITQWRQRGIDPTTGAPITSNLAESIATIGTFFTLKGISTQLRKAHNVEFRTIKDFELLTKGLSGQKLINVLNDIATKPVVQVRTLGGLVRRTIQITEPLRYFAEFKRAEILRGAGEGVKISQLGVGEPLELKGDIARQLGIEGTQFLITERLKLAYQALEEGLAGNPFAFYVARLLVDRGVDLKTVMDAPIGQRLSQLHQGLGDLPGVRLTRPIQSYIRGLKLERDFMDFQQSLLPEFIREQGIDPVEISNLELQWRNGTPQFADLRGTFNVTRLTELNTLLKQFDVMKIVRVQVGALEVNGQKSAFRFKADSTLAMRMNEFLDQFEQIRHKTLTLDQVETYRNATSSYYEALEKGTGFGKSDILAPLLVSVLDIFKGGYRKVVLSFANKQLMRAALKPEIKAFYETLKLRVVEFDFDTVNRLSLKGRMEFLQNLKEADIVYLTNDALGFSLLDTYLHGRASLAKFGRQVASYHEFYKHVYRELTNKSFLLLDEVHRVTSLPEFIAGKSKGEGLKPEVVSDLTSSLEFLEAEGFVKRTVLPDGKAQFTTDFLLKSVEVVLEQVARDFGISLETLMKNPEFKGLKTLVVELTLEEVEFTKVVHQALLKRVIGEEAYQKLVDVNGNIPDSVLKEFIDPTSARYNDAFAHQVAAANAIGRAIESPRGIHYTVTHLGLDEKPLKGGATRVAPVSPNGEIAFRQFFSDPYKGGALELIAKPREGFMPDLEGVRISPDAVKVRFSEVIYDIERSGGNVLGVTGTLSQVADALHIGLKIKPKLAEGILEKYFGGKVEGRVVEGILTDGAIHFGAANPASVLLDLRPTRGQSIIVVDGTTLFDRPTTLEAFHSASRSWTRIVLDLDGQYKIFKPGDMKGRILEGGEKAAAAKLGEGVAIYLGRNGFEGTNLVVAKGVSQSTARFVHIFDRKATLSEFAQSLGRNRGLNPEAESIPAKRLHPFEAHFVGVEKMSLTKLYKFLEGNETRSIRSQKLHLARETLAESPVNLLRELREVAVRNGAGDEIIKVIDDKISEYQNTKSLNAHLGLGTLGNVLESLELAAARAQHFVVSKLSPHLMEKSGIEFYELISKDPALKEILDSAILDNKGEVVTRLQIKFGEVEPENVARAFDSARNPQDAVGLIEENMTRDQLPHYSGSGATHVRIAAAVFQSEVSMARQIFQKLGVSGEVLDTIMPHLIDAIKANRERGAPSLALPNFLKTILPQIQPLIFPSLHQLPIGQNVTPETLNATLDKLADLSQDEGFLTLPLGDQLAAIQEITPDLSTAMTLLNPILKFETISVQDLGFQTPVVEQARFVNTGKVFVLSDAIAPVRYIFNSIDPRLFMTVETTAKNDLLRFGTIPIPFIWDNDALKPLEGTMVGPQAIPTFVQPQLSTLGIRSPEIAGGLRLQDTILFHNRFNRPLLIQPLTLNDQTTREVARRYQDVNSTPLNLTQGLNEFVLLDAVSRQIGQLFYQGPRLVFASLKLPKLFKAQTDFLKQILNLTETELDTFTVETIYDLQGAPKRSHFFGTDRLRAIQEVLPKLEGGFLRLASLIRQLEGQPLLDQGTFSQWEVPNSSGNVVEKKYLVDPQGQVLFEERASEKKVVYRYADGKNGDLVTEEELATRRIGQRQIATPQEAGRMVYDMIPLAPEGTVSLTDLEIRSFAEELVRLNHTSGAPPLAHLALLSLRLGLGQDFPKLLKLYNPLLDINVSEIASSLRNLYAYQLAKFLDTSYDNLTQIRAARELVRLPENQLLQTEQTAQGTLYKDMSGSLVLTETATEEGLRYTLAAHPTKSYTLNQTTGKVLFSEESIRYRTTALSSYIEQYNLLHPESPITDQDPIVVYVQYDQSEQSMKGHYFVGDRRLMVKRFDRVSIGELAASQDPEERRIAQVMGGAYRFGKYQPVIRILTENPDGRVSQVFAVDEMGRFVADSPALTTMQYHFEKQVQEQGKPLSLLVLDFNRKDAEPGGLSTFETHSSRAVAVHPQFLMNLDREILPSGDLMVPQLGQRNLGESIAVGGLLHEFGHQQPHYTRFVTQPLKQLFHQAKVGSPEKKLLGKLYRHALVMERQSTSIDYETVLAEGIKVFEKIATAKGISQGVKKSATQQLASLRQTGPYEGTFELNNSEPLAERFRGNRNFTWNVGAHLWYWAYKSGIHGEKPLRHFANNWFERYDETEYPDALRREDRKEKIIDYLVLADNVYMAHKESRVAPHQEELFALGAKRLTPEAGALVAADMHASPPTIERIKAKLTPAKREGTTLGDGTAQAKDGEMKSIGPIQVEGKPYRLQFVKGETPGTYDQVTLYAPSGEPIGTVAFEIRPTEEGSVVVENPIPMATQQESAIFDALYAGLFSYLKAYTPYVNLGLKINFTDTNIGTVHPAISMALQNFGFEPINGQKIPIPQGPTFQNIGVKGVQIPEPTRFIQLGLSNRYVLANLDKFNAQMAHVFNVVSPTVEAAGDGGRKVLSIAPFVSGGKVVLPDWMATKFVNPGYPMTLKNLGQLVTSLHRENDIKVYYYGIGGGPSEVAAGAQDIDILSPLLATDFDLLIGADLSKGNAGTFQRKVEKELRGVEGVEHLRFDAPRTEGDHPVYTARFTYGGKERVVKVLYNFDALRDIPSDIVGGYQVLYSRGLQSALNRMDRPVRQALLGKLDSSKGVAILELPKQSKDHFGKEFVKVDLDEVIPSEWQLVNPNATLTHQVVMIKGFEAEILAQLNHAVAAKDGGVQTTTPEIETTLPQPAMPLPVEHAAGIRLARRQEVVVDGSYTKLVLSGRMGDIPQMTPKDLGKAILLLNRNDRLLLDESIDRIVLPDKFIKTLHGGTMKPVELVKLLVIMSRILKSGGIDAIHINGINLTDIQELQNILQQVDFKDLPVTPQGIADFINHIERNLSTQLFVEQMSLELERQV